MHVLFVAGATRGGETPRAWEAADQFRRVYQERGDPITWVRAGSESGPTSSSVLPDVTMSWPLLKPLIQARINHQWLPPGRREDFLRKPTTSPQPRLCLTFHRTQHLVQQRWKDLPTSQRLRLQQGSAEPWPVQALTTSAEFLSPHDSLEIPDPQDAQQVYTPDVVEWASLWVLLSTLPVPYGDITILVATADLEREYLATLPAFLLSVGQQEDIERLRVFRVSEA